MSTQEKSHGAEPAPPGASGLPRHLRIFEWLMYASVVISAWSTLRQPSWGPDTFLAILPLPILAVLTWAAARRGQAWAALVILIFVLIGVVSVAGSIWFETLDGKQASAHTTSDLVVEIVSVLLSILAVAVYFVGNARAGAYSKPPAPKTLDGIPQTVPLRETCANCRTPLVGLYCHNCSQSSAPALLGLREGTNGIIKAFFKVDHKLLRTLRLVFFSPGKLSLDFHNGIYERYRPPLRFIFLISAIVMLALALTDIRLSQTYFIYGPDARVTRDADGTPDLHDVNVIFAMIARPGPLQNAPPEFLASLERELAQTTKDDWIERSMLRYWRAVALQDPRLSRWGLAVPLLVLVIAPLFAWLSMLFFRGKRYPFSDHLIFSIHVHSAALLFLLAVIPIVHLLPGAMLLHHFMMLYALLLTSYIVTLVARSTARLGWLRSARVSCWEPLTVGSSTGPAGR